MPDALLVVGGLVALLTGAELVVRAGTGIATRLGVRPIVIGLTVVSLGTSMPELAVGVDAAVSGSPGLAVGNIVGTNLVNILLILGLSAALVPIALERTTLRFDLPVMTGVALLLVVVLSIDGTLSRLDGAVLLLAAIAYTVGLWRMSRRGPADLGETPPVASRGPLVLTLLLVVGLAVIVLGAELLVDGAVSAAHALGVSESVIGLTVVAIGTSAPELVTTVLSTVRGERDIAIGNLFGSSIYNIGAVLAVTIVVAPGGLPVPRDVLVADLLLLGVVAVAAVPVFLSGARISRLEGAAFVAAYAAYLIWLLWSRT
jgi:cation:H+ antiporter